MLHAWPATQVHTTSSFLKSSAKATRKGCRHRTHTLTLEQKRHRIPTKRWVHVSLDTFFHLEELAQEH